jgi:Zn-dependent M28 family amino/carboxypeptidase
MRQKLAYVLIAVMLLSLLFAAYQQFRSSTGPIPPPVVHPTGPQVNTPEFNADSAYNFVAEQVKFGPRVPNSEAHRKCAAWYVSAFKSLGLNVIEQKFQATHYKGTVFNANNIIAQYKPSLNKRICIAAHWDSRFIADSDDHDQNKPIDGADDGASGVGVMLELARTLSKNSVDIGVDFICFDVEDQGDDNGAAESWCLGSQYWSKNLHAFNYMPYQAVLFDMIGGKDARFYKEGVSLEVAPSTVDKIWRIANNLGFSAYFPMERRPGITDDHLFVVRNARIPMVDIISMPNDGQHPFPTHHHKHSDNMEVIDRNTLKAVGQTMTAFIYQTYNGVL